MELGQCSSFAIIVQALPFHSLQSIERTTNRRTDRKPPPPPPPPPPPSSWSEPCVASYRMEDTKNLLIRKTGKLVKNLIRITTQRTIQILWGSAQPSRPTLYQVLLVTIIISMLYIQPHVTRPWENKQETFLKSTACTHQIWITPYKAIN